MTQQNRQQNQGKTNSSRERQTGQGSATGTSQQSDQPAQCGQQQETPEQWLEENSLGDPDETGNTITGENEY